MRLKSEIWVKSYIRARSADNVMAVLVRRGDPDAGTIFILIDHMNGMCSLYGPAPAGLDMVDRERRWVQCPGEGSVGLEEANRYLENQMEMDPDIWVIEVEDADGRHFLDEAIVRD